MAMKPVQVAAGVLLVLFALSESKRVDINNVVDASEKEAKAQERRSYNEKSRRVASIMFSHHQMLGTALPPGFEDELYCPPEFCMHNKPQQAGFTGPRSMFVECKHKAGTKDPQPVTTWGSRKPASDREQLLSDKYHQEECSEHFDGEEKPAEEPEDDAQQESTHICGAITFESDACYPRERDWIGSLFDAKACSTQCTKQAGMCMCPNSGESCSSVMANDPGLITLFPWYVIGRPIHYAVKMDKKTREWEYLSCDWDGAVKRCSWKAPHVSAGKSYMDNKFLGTTYQAVVAPNPDFFKNGEVPGFETKADFCKPEVAAKFIEKLGKFVGELPGGR